MTPQEKIKALQELKDPSLKINRILADSEIAKVILQMNQLQGVAGNDGKTPVKGQDYFTEQDISSIIERVQSQIKPGDKGVDGNDGKDGQTPFKGIDYWTKEDQQKILREVLSQIPKPKDGLSPNIDDVIKGVATELKKNPIEFKDIKGTEQLVAFLKSGGFRGGGDTVAAGNGISITSNTSGQKIISANGSSFSSFTITGTQNSSNTVFTLSSAPSISAPTFLFVNGQKQISTAYSISGTTLTFLVTAPESTDTLEFFGAGITVIVDTTLATTLKAWAYSQSYALISGTRNTNEALTSGTIQWPDGSTGVFTATTLSTSFPGAIDAYTVTYVSGAVTKTITQSLLTRDAAGAVTAQPALTIA